MTDGVELWLLSSGRYWGASVMAAFGARGLERWDFMAVMSAVFCVAALGAGLWTTWEFVRTPRPYATALAAFKERERAERSG
ncbi:hypothetical protein [Streptomyces sp. NPDC060194]|uniref:hypothetical protein n=1 Tax=Streptomyces sp. NPDC060194 TaxID=3347069 RepID=UPI003648BD3E